MAELPHQNVAGAAQAKQRACVSGLQDGGRGRCPSAGARVPLTH